MDGLKQYVDMLGYRFRDRITYFEGVAESISFDLFGCVQIALKPQITKDKDGAPTMHDGRWFDASRLVQSSHERVMEVPTFARIDPTETRNAAPGPADKSSYQRA